MELSSYLYYPVLFFKKLCPKFKFEYALRAAMLPALKMVIMSNHIYLHSSTVCVCGGVEPTKRTTPGIFYLCCDWGVNSNSEFSVREKMELLKRVGRFIKILIKTLQCPYSKPNVDLILPRWIICILMMAFRFNNTSWGSRTL